MNCAAFPILKQPTVCTLGYEGAELEDFIATLHAVGVQHVIDVREYPISRKKGFSKKSFSAALVNAGLQYSHIVELGCPKAVRDQYRIDGDWSKYQIAFESYLETQDGKVNELRELVQHAIICLICYERDQNFCHRSNVAKAIQSKESIAIRHLGVKKGIAVGTLNLV